MKIGTRRIGKGQEPYIIAEMSGNHNGSLARALKIVDAAAAAGAHAVKLQTFTADSMTLDCSAPDFMVKSNNPLWEGERLYDLYKKAHTPRAWHKALFDRARKRGIAIFSSPFDESAVDFLESLGAPAYKVASFENNHLPLLRRIARTRKPVIMSTGMTTKADLKESVGVLRASGCRELVLLKCTSSYPSDPADSNLLTIPELAKAFRCEAGLSDHTPGIGVPLAAVALGASVIEKHFTLNRADGGVDSAFSIEPAELKQLVLESKAAVRSLGRISFDLTPQEKANLAYKRSLYFSRDVKSGETLTPFNVAIVRPGKGLHPREYERVLGRKARKAARMGTAVSWSLVS